MGRTVLAYSIQLEILEKRLSSFRRGLRKEDQNIFDDILRWGKNQVQSGVLASSANPSDPVFWAAFIEIKRAIDSHSREIQRFREKLKSPNDENRPVSRPADESRPVSQSADENRPASWSADENRPTSWPADENRPVSHPADENRPVSRPAGENRPASRPADENREASPPADESLQAEQADQETEERFLEQEAKFEFLKEEVSEIKLKVDEMADLMQILYRDFETFRRLSEE